LTFLYTQHAGRRRAGWGRRRKEYVSDRRAQGIRKPRPGTQIRWSDEWRRKEHLDD